MLIRTSVCLMAMAAMGSWNLHAVAEEGGFTLGAAPKTTPAPIYTNEVTLGAGFSSVNSFKFGEYTGLQSRSPFGIGSVTIRSLAPWDGKSNEFWNIIGTNLGLESRSLYMDYGRQGQYRLGLFYDQVPHYRLDDAVSPFVGAGGREQTLPAGWVGGTTTAGFTALAGSLRGIDIKTERMKFGGKMSINLNQQWKINAKYLREIKTGTETMSAIFGTNGGNMRSVILATPIDQTTDNIKAGVSFTGKTYQFALNYNLSLFNSDANSVAWSNPYNSGSWAAAATFAGGGRGLMSLTPDNIAHQINATGGINLGETTRVTGSFSYGRMLQNDTFHPFTSNTALVVPVGLPRNSLMGRIDTWHATLTGTTRPTRRLSLTSRYLYDYRNNLTPRDVYLTVKNDSQNQPGLVTANARINKPYSYKTHKVDLKARYRLFKGVSLTGGYTFDWRYRDFQERTTTYEHTALSKLQFRLNQHVSGWASYDSSWRRGNEYNSNEPFLVSHTPAYLATLSFGGLFENDPALRKVYLANRNQDRVKAALIVTPVDRVTLGFRTTYSMEDYKNSAVGIQERSNLSVTGDISLEVTKKLNLYGHVTHEFISSLQRGYARGGGSLTPGAGRTDSFWTADSRDSVLTAGAGLEWNAIKDRLKFIAEYDFSRGSTQIEFMAGTLVAFAPLPNLVTTSHSAGLRAVYKFKKKWALNVGYNFRYVRTSDFALDNVGVNSLGSTLLLGNQPATYTAHAVGISLSYHW